ncbi:helix-turn-helix domain-containing protein [Micromonospora echinofusca]|uniref:helix-turn-helix domain-containing protein n=1 Tax=Micromonospora echinofusca TaxID=47858 RepID=UPI0033DB421E
MEAVGISPSEYLLRELRRRRAAAGLTQAQLGELVFCSDSQVSAIETGAKPPTAPYLTAVDKALDTGGYFATLWNEQTTGQPDAIARVGLAWAAVRGEALPLRQSLDVLKEAAKTWTS